MINDRRYSLVYVSFRNWLIGRGGGTQGGKLTMLEGKVSTEVIGGINNSWRGSTAIWRGNLSSHPLNETLYNLVSGLIIGHRTLVVN